MPAELPRQLTHELPQLAPEISPNLELGPNVLQRIRHNMEQTTGGIPSPPQSILRTNQLQQMANRNN